MSLNKERPLGAVYNPNRFNSLDSALAFIAVLAAFYFVPTILFDRFKTFFKAVYEYDYYAYMSINAIISQGIIFVVAAIFSAVKRVNAFDGGGYKAKFDGVAIMMGMVLITGIMLTFYYVHLRFGEDAETILGSYFPSEINQSSLTPIFVIVYLALIAFLPAIIEEMMFRGIIMRGLESFGTFAAVIISSVAFSLMHGNFSQTILQFFGGIAIGAAVILTKNWLVGSAMHFFNNLFSTLYAIVISDELITEPSLVYVPFVADAACIVIGITCLIVGALYFYKLSEKINKCGYAEISGGARRAKAYAVKLGEDTNLKPHYDCAELRNRKLDDKKRYYIFGKFRKMNFKANPTVSGVLLALGAVIAIISMFI